MNTEPDPVEDGLYEVESDLPALPIAELQAMIRQLVARVVELEFLVSALIDGEYQAIEFHREQNEKEKT